MRLRVVRTIIMEGSEEWIRATLAKSCVSPDKPFEFGFGNTITEMSRIEMPVNDANTDTAADTPAQTPKGE